MATITMDFEVQSLVKKDKEKIDFRRFIKEYKHKKTFVIEEKIYFLFFKKSDLVILKWRPKPGYI